MAYRTIRRNPMSVDVNSLNEQYFNFASFAGINSNKNYVGVNQYSFDDANNVYVDQNSQLHTRPPIKSITISVLEPDEYPVDIVKVNNVTFYKTYNGSEYRYRFKYHDEWRVLPSTQKSLITFINDYFVIFLEDDIILVGWNYDDNNIRIYQSTEGNNIVYIPITKIVQGNTTLENEAKNLLTTKEITRYLFEYGDSIPANAIDLVGQTVTVNINGKEYSVTLQQGTPIIFAEPISDLNLDSISYSGIQSSDNGVILIWTDDHIYLSNDGQIFSIYDYPSELQDTPMKEVCLSRDGTEIVAVSNITSKVYDDPAVTDGKYRYITNVYYMYTPYYSSDSTWKKMEITLLEAYDNLLTMVSEGIGPRFNVAFRNDYVDASTHNDHKGYSSVYNAINYVLSFVPSCVSTDEMVIVYKAWINGGHYSYSSDAFNFHFETGYTTAQTDALFLVRIYRNSNDELVSSVKFGTVQRSQYFGDTVYESIPLMYSQVLSTTPSAFTPVLYTETNSFKIIAWQAYTSEYIPYRETSSPYNNASFLYNSHDILYSVIDADDNILHGFGIQFPNKYSADMAADSNFDSVPYLYVMPTVFNTLYKSKYKPDYNPSIPGNNIAPDLTTVDDYVTLHGNGRPAVIRYNDSVLEYIHVGNEANGYNTNGTINHINTITLTLTAQLDYYARYNENAYSDIIDYQSTTNYSNIQISRMNYPIWIANSSSGSRNQAESERYVVSSIVSTSISVLNGSDILTSDFYYYQATIYPLLNYSNNRLLPAYVGTETLDNNTSYGKILYYNDSDGKMYSNKFSGTVSIDITSSGDTSYIVPDFSEDFITTTIVLNNLLYQSLNRTFEGTETGESSTVHPELYFPINSEVKFIDKITNLIVFSQTSLGVFLEDLVYEYQYNTDNDMYTLTPTKLQLGCKEGADILIGYDGSTIYMTQLKGLAGLNYQDFVQSTEQVYTYFTDAIMDLYDKFKGDGKIKLYQYKDWIFMYKQDNTELYIFDTRSSTWWKWTNPYPIQKIVFDGNNLLLLINNQIAIYNFEDDNDFSDFVGTEITWHFRSQKLHFNAPNNYKHIRQLNIITAQDGIELRYKLKFINYRNLNNLSETDTVLFDIDQLTTLIKRVNFMKTNAFQFEISSDETDPHAKHFETPDIVIKYRITEAVR